MAERRVAEVYFVPLYTNHAKALMLMGCQMAFYTSQVVDSACAWCTSWDRQELRGALTMTPEHMQKISLQLCAVARSWGAAT